MRHDLHACRGLAALEGRHRDRSPQRGHPGGAVVCAIHRHAPGRGADPELGAHRYRGPHLQGTSLERHCVARTARYDPARRHPRQAARRKRKPGAWSAHVGVSVTDQRLRPSQGTRNICTAGFSEAAGAKFWFQGMRNCYLAVAERGTAVAILSLQSVAQSRAYRRDRCRPPCGLDNRSAP